MWFNKQYSIKQWLLVGLLTTIAYAASAQFNRYYWPDLDSVNTAQFQDAVLTDENEIVAIKSVYEYHSGAEYQAWHYYLETFDLTGERLSVDTLNKIYPLDTIYNLWIDDVLMETDSGYQMFSTMRNQFERKFYTLKISKDLEEFSLVEITDTLFDSRPCISSVSKAKKDPWGGYFVAIDFPEPCITDHPGKNRIFHMNENGELDWYRTSVDNFPYSETITDITRHPETGEIFYCGNYALTGNSPCYQNESRYCDNMAFVYRCDSLGLNCERIYFGRDSVDAHQECNFINVLSNGNLALSHPIITQNIFWDFATGIPRFRELDREGNVIRDYVDDFAHSGTKFTAFFQQEGGRSLMMYRETWAIEGNVHNGNQVYIRTSRINTYNGTEKEFEQPIYHPEKIFTWSEYRYWFAKQYGNQLLLGGQLFIDTLGKHVPYMVLTDSNGCIPDIPCIPVGIADKVAPIFNGNLAVFPNPAHNELTITLSANTTIWLYDLQGRAIANWQGQQGQQTYPLEHIPPGMYIVTAGKEFAKILVE